MFDWIHHYQLFLFDFDGLLVNTEEIHYLAYKKMCALHGVDFDWTFERYCQIAHYSSEGLREHLYGHYPQLQAIQPDWNLLYAEKKQAVIDLFNSGAVHLMPGVEKLLNALHQARIPSCVVTHSAKELITAIRRQHPIFDTIHHWITREHYSHAKPHPECYLTAIEKFAQPDDHIIGFEDTPRGLKALLATRAKPVLICTIPYPEIPAFQERGVLHFPSFEAITDI